MQCCEILLRFEPGSDTPAGGLAAWWRIETWAREGVYLGSQLPVDAVPGKSGQGRAEPGLPPDRVFSIRTLWPEMELFLCFVEAFFKTCDTMLRQWVVKSRPFCMTMLRQWEGKSDDFPCFLQESY